MKNFKKTIPLLILLFVFIFNSCNTEQDEIIEREENRVSFSNFNLSELEEFETAIYESDLVNLGVSLENSIADRDIEKLALVENSISAVRSDLIDNFGEENINSYLLTLAENETDGEHDGSPCTRNEDGSIYLGACSFWEKVSFFLSLECVGLSTDTTEEIEEKFNCYQTNICGICS